MSWSKMQTGGGVKIFADIMHMYLHAPLERVETPIVKWKKILISPRFRWDMSLMENVRGGARDERIYQFFLPLTELAFCVTFLRMLRYADTAAARISALAKRT